MGKDQLKKHEKVRMLKPSRSVCRGHRIIQTSSATGIARLPLVLPEEKTMMLKTGSATIGAVIPIGGVVVPYLLIGANWNVLAITAGAVCGVGLLSYIIAAATAETGFGEFMRGWLIGLNAALNIAFGFAIASQIAGPEAGAIFGGVLGLINLLCVFAPVSQNGFFQGVIGWLNWIMPMSWPIVLLGILFYVLSFMLHLVTGAKVEYLRIQDFGADWKTGTVFMRGGLVANLNYLDTAFNMGNFSFVDYKSGAWHKEHEAGHTLNLAAFGFAFHLIGAIDENAFRGAQAYSERLAESHASGVGGSNIPMWA
jgi:hypothetical protein